jgi:hypothetical protein
MKKYTKFYLFSAIACAFIFSGHKTLAAGTYVDQGIGFYAQTTAPTSTDNPSLTAVYRFYNAKTGDHFYTASKQEQVIVANTSKSGYASEGIAFYAYSTQITGTLPVYRFYDAKTGDHLYTTSETEKTSLLGATSGYKYESIAFYAYATQVSPTLPVYRLYNSTTGDHLYTASLSERNTLLASPLGPNISVGLWGYNKSDISSSPFQITADKPYNIVDKNGKILGQVTGSSTTKVEYDSNSNLKIYNSIASVDSNTSVSFQPTDGDPSIIFNVHRPNSSYDHYRGSIKLQYYHGTDIVGGTSSTVSQVWVINTLPLEEYVWGMGETTGTGPTEHTKVMTTIFRTYGFWYIKYATKYAPYGFQIRSDSGSQIYLGEDWENKYSNIKKDAQDTRGIFATYKSDVALTPYSSWSDGKTRSYKDVWGSKDYPWCAAVKDPYGKGTKAQYQASGNHMVGLIANGSLKLAGSSYKWSYNKIMKYYYTGISLPTNY